MRVSSSRTLLTEESETRAGESAIRWSSTPHLVCHIAVLLMMYLCLAAPRPRLPAGTASLNLTLDSDGNQEDKKELAASQIDLTIESDSANEEVGPPSKKRKGSGRL